MANLQPFSDSLIQEDGARLLTESDERIVLDYGTHLSLLRLEGEPYQFIELEDEGNAYLLLEEQPSDRSIGIH